MRFGKAGSADSGQPGEGSIFIGDPVITVDTTEFAEVDEASAIETVRRAAGLS